MSSALSITRAVNPPRAAFLDFPLGHTTGKAGEPELQRAILRAALAGFRSIATPGGVEVLPFTWSEDEAWKDAAMRPPEPSSDPASTDARDQRSERYETPQYQCETDRALAEQAEREGGCPTCVWLE